MSALTLADLLAADPAPFAAAAHAWEALAEDLDNAAEQLIRGTRTLPEAWPDGPAAEAAQAQAARLRAEVSNAYNPARRIFQALRHHADAIGGLRGQAQGLVAEARGAGCTVDVAAGVLNGPPELQMNGTLSAYIVDLNSVLERARELDDSTANTINVNLPDPVDGFGALSLPPLSREDLLAQQGRDPRDVNAWWLSLTPQQQEQAIHDHPDLVGWLDGIPSTDRDTANRLRLAQEKADFDQRAEELRNKLQQLYRGPGDLSEDQWTQQIADTQQELAGIEKKRADLDKVTRTLDGLGDKGLLLGIDPAGDGKAIVAVGNPDTAEHTAVWVPGLNTELEDISSNTNRVKNIQLAADRLTPEAGDVAAIMWLGYDAPELDLSVVTDDRSKQGGVALDAYVNGLHATHQGDPGHMTVIGHSYGSTVVAEAALAGDGLATDDLVTAGSPGMHTDHASDLQLDPRHVWAGSAEDDPVSNPHGHHGKYVDYIPIVGTWIDSAEDGMHGISPQDPLFGANQYHVDTSGHSAYWTEGSESLTNQANIVVGNYNAVTLDHGSAPQ